MILPPALKTGDTIGIMAPSSRVDHTALGKSAARLNSLGYTVFNHPQTFSTNGQSAGTAREKVDALHLLFSNSMVKAIFTAGGGNQAGALLPLLDYKLIKKNPKIMIGYSDVTALLQAIWKETKIASFHGAGATRFASLADDQAEQTLNLLSGQPADLPFSNAVTIVQQGTASGTLTGGNLSLLVSLLGTPWQPDFDGALLFLEDCGDELSRIDRMFLHLANAGVFRRIKGLILGGFTGLTDTGRLPYEKTVIDMVREKLDGLGIPIVADAPFGHGENLYALPIGVPATLQATARGATLKLDGPAVAR